MVHRGEPPWVTASLGDSGENGWLDALLPGERGDAGVVVALDAVELLRRGLRDSVGKTVLK